ncbi:hypothetical protein BZL29_5383 [Mycobacterium kansasii]|uniref:Uncharacterized protein n=1 Tax=Mycobacterium kansasii TaxID=1768 RepID=A0A1V3X2E8_MYCKA|nr:hypothetical protein BZL29_5383 [Mycobacterium kansasii]
MRANDADRRRRADRVRTVRNLLAATAGVQHGERVEANTSTVWTYLLYVAQLGRRADAAGICGAARA